MEFEWDSGKAEANLRKHRVSFEDAARVFLDPHRIETVDDRENYGEDRLEDRGPGRARSTGRRLYRSRQGRQSHPIDFSKKGRCP
jgi:uncharacterized DUF497 family protein